MGVLVLQFLDDGLADGIWVMIWKRVGACENLCLCKGPEAGTGLAGVRDSNEANWLGQKDAGESGRQWGQKDRSSCVGPCRPLSWLWLLPWVRQNHWRVLSKAVLWPDLDFNGITLMSGWNLEWAGQESKQGDWCSTLARSVKAQDEKVAPALQVSCT